MTKKEKSQVLGGIVLLIIGSVLVILNTNFYAFVGIFLLLWANNIGLKLNEI